MTTEKVSNLAIRVLGIYALQTGASSAIAVIPPLFKSIYYNEIQALGMITYILFLVPLIMGILFIIRPQLITRGITYTTTDFDLGAIYQLTLKVTGILLMINSGRMLLPGLSFLQKNLSAGMMHDYLFYGGVDLVLQVSLVVVGIVICIKSKAISDKCAQAK